MHHTHSDDQLASIAFTTAYRQHSVGLRRFVGAIILDRYMAEDVVHETYLELWRHPERFDPTRADLQSWLRTIAHRRAVDRIRSTQSARDRDVRVGTRDHHDVDRSSDQWDAVFGRPELRAALATLTTKQRDAVILRYLGEHSTPEVAEHLGISVGTAKTRVRDGLLALRVQLQEPSSVA
ncbi:hypothetical protein ASG04_16880 [Curtobacterium sp. Leaf183]|uniref:sigma-70 family RNA polymerase sigma factor n=1 Tax=Curtobacterium sp. Leaf183 TaxID=1736291 RepID=UPI000700D5BC|nr:sigma-70 family RNA polymerase sigma factor [Curtobacterium sp. Leaf183]KQS06222.1 hypothetical protein ASG04_16880 [Curtobacterium sp. Leaf183]